MISQYLVPSQNFTILPPAIIGEILLFFYYVSDYMKDMVTLIAVVKVYSTEYFCNIIWTIGIIFVQQTFRLTISYR